MLSLVGCPVQEIVEQVEAMRRQHADHPHKALIVRLLFILTRCSRLLISGERSNPVPLATVGLNRHAHCMPVSIDDVAQQDMAYCSHSISVPVLLSCGTPMPTR